MGPDDRDDFPTPPADATEAARIGAPDGLSSRPSEEELAAWEERLRRREEELRRRADGETGSPDDSAR